MLFKNRCFPLFHLTDEEMKLYRTELAQGVIIASEKVPVIPMSEILKPVLPVFLQTNSLSTGFYDCISGLNQRQLVTTFLPTL